MATWCETLSKLEQEIYDEFATQADLTNKMNEGDLMLKLLDLVWQYKNDVHSQQFKDDAQALIESTIDTGLIRKLEWENGKLLATANAEKSIFKFQTDLEKYLVEGWMTWVGDPGATHTKIIRFLNKTYKFNTLWPVLGRVFMEPFQAMSVLWMEKLDTYMNHKIPVEYKGKVPNWGRLNKNQPFAQREFGNGFGIYGANTLKVKEFGVSKVVNAIGSSLLKLQAGIMDPAMSKIENELYQSIADKMWMEKVKMPGGEYLVKDMLTPQNQVKKNNTIQEIKRKATAEAKKMFFNYVDNPLVIHKMEEYIPFTNFLYSGLRQMVRYPKSMMFISSVLNQMQYTFGDEAWYEDEDWQRIDAGVRLRMPILASIGLGNVQINANRFVTFTPTSVGIGMSPLFSYITNRDDYRWKKYYETGKIGDLIEWAMVSMWGTLPRLISDASRIEPWKKWETDYWSNVASTLGYMATGMPMKDKTQMAATQAFILWDVDSLLNMNDLQFQEFARRQSRWGWKDWETVLTKKWIEIAKKAMDMWLMDQGNKPNSFWKIEVTPEQARKKIILAVVGMWLHDSVVDKTQLKEQSENIMHLADLIVWSEIPNPWSSDFMGFVNKVNELSKEKWFKEFEAYSPAMYKIWNHYVENYNYYKDDDKTKKIGAEKWYGSKDHLSHLLANKYQFEWDEGMSIDQKVIALQSGKIYKVKLAVANNDAGIPAGPLMTSWYWKHLDNKWALVNNYLQDANELMGYQSIRKFYGSMYYAAKTSWDKKWANEYWQKSQIAYNKEKESYRKFHLSWDATSWQEFLLSDANQSFKNKVDKASQYVSNQQSRDAKITAKKFDKYSSMSEKEKDIMKNVFHTNVDMKKQMTALEMWMDSGNPHYADHTKYQDLFRSIINN